MTTEEIFKPLGEVEVLNNELSVIYLPNHERDEAFYERFFIGYPIHSERVNDGLKITRFKCVLYIGAIQDNKLKNEFRYLASLNDVDNTLTCGKTMEVVSARIKPYNDEPIEFKNEVISRLKSLVETPTKYFISGKYTGFDKKLLVTSFLEDALSDAEGSSSSYPKDERINVVIPKLCFVRYSKIENVNSASYSELMNIYHNREQIALGFKHNKFGTFVITNLKFNDVLKKITFKSIIGIDKNNKVRGNNFCMIINHPEPTLEDFSFIEILDCKKSSELFGYRKIKNEMVGKIYRKATIRKRFKCNKDGVYRDIIEIYNPEVKRSVKFTASDIKFHIIDISKITKGIQPKKDRTIDINTKVYISPKISKIYNLPNKAVATVKNIDYTKESKFKSRYTGKQVKTTKDCYTQLLVDGNNLDVICKMKYLKKI